MHDHNHSITESTSTKSIRLAFFLNLAFAIFEILGSFWTNSLSIFSTGLHDLGDSLSLGLSWYLNRVSGKGRTSTFSYGYKRFSLAAALINSIVILVGSLYVITEAIPRLLNPEHSNASGMILFALIGIGVNGIAVLKLKKESDSLQQKVLIWHLLDDVLGWAAVLAISLITIVQDIHILDPILSLLITLYVLWNVLKNLKKVVLIFLQSVPETIDLHRLEQQIRDLKGVVTLHDTHLWSLDGTYNVLTTHIVLDKNVPIPQGFELKSKIKTLAQQQGIQHATLEMESFEESCTTTDCL